MQGGQAEVGPRLDPHCLIAPGAAATSQACIQGIPTRSVDGLVEALGMEGISKSQVSRLCEEIDDRVHPFLDWPIEGVWPYVWLDARPT